MRDHPTVHSGQKALRSPQICPRRSFLEDARPSRLACRERRTSDTYRRGCRSMTVLIVDDHRTDNMAARPTIRSPMTLNSGRQVRSAKLQSP